MHTPVVKTGKQYLGNRSIVCTNYAITNTHIHT
jgi:hypothetical protein